MNAAASLLAWCLLLAATGAVLPACAAASAATVARPVANLYRSPSLKVDVVTQAIYGAPLTIVESKRRWFRVRMEDNYEGWIPARDVRKRAPTEPPYGSLDNGLRVSSLFAHLYFEPNVTTRAPLLTVPFEARLEAAPAPPPNRRWLAVRLVDGTVAFVQQGDVVKQLPRLSVAETIEFSKRFLNLPYTWGGTSSYGYDCSGFTQMLYRQRGIFMPRDAHDQAAWEGLAPVPLESPAPGDLLYFGENAQKITHTGFYLGDGLFIHATTHEQPVTQISRLADEHWRRLLVAVRRPR